MHEIEYHAKFQRTLDKLDGPKGIEALNSLEEIETSIKFGRPIPRKYNYHQVTATRKNTFGIFGSNLKKAKLFSCHVLGQSLILTFAKRDRIYHFLCLNSHKKCGVE